MRYTYSSQAGKLQDTAALAAVAPAEAPPEAPPEDRELVRNLGTRRIAREIVALVPAHVAWEHLVMPLAFDGETVTLAARNPQNGHAPPPGPPCR